jgi:hypothetical protein
MNNKQKEHERRVGDRFIDWLNKTTQFAFVFHEAPAPPDPDLLYKWQENELPVEITDAYYDWTHGKFIGKLRRQEPDAAGLWDGVGDNDSALASEVAHRIIEKSKKPYPAGTILLIQISPGLTTFEALQALLHSESLEGIDAFAGVYVVGTFPAGDGRINGYQVFSAGGYHVITLKPLSHLPSN